MKLLAIYNVFDGEELLKGSLRQIRDHVDGIIAVVQSISNYGEMYEGGVNECRRLYKEKLIDHIHYYHPNIALGGTKNETNKRQIGLEYGKENGYDHFIHMDCDEYYDSEQFLEAKKIFMVNNFEGSVCNLQTYFKEPTLTLDGLDNYYVPFIHKLRKSTVTGVRGYPFYCDPTRTINAKKIKAFSPTVIVMHHYSFVRNDINRKLNNSSARLLAKNKGVLEDYYSAKEGMYIAQYQKKLIRTENKFGI